MTLYDWLLIIIPSVLLVGILVYNNDKQDSWFLVRMLLASLCIATLALVGILGVSELRMLQDKEPKPQYEPVQEQLYRIKQ